MSFSLLLINDYVIFNEIVLFFDFIDDLGVFLIVKFVDLSLLGLAAVVTHVADARTCVLHPASTTHRQLSDAQLIDAGVSPDLIRLSVGIEDKDDIIADIEQALNNSK